MKKTKRPSKIEALTDTVEQFRAHDDTQTLRRRHSVLAFERDTIDAELFDLGARAAAMRDRRAKVEATMRGLARVVNKRR